MIFNRIKAAVAQSRTPVWAAQCALQTEGNYLLAVQPVVVIQHIQKYCDG